MWLIVCVVYVRFDVATTKVENRLKDYKDDIKNYNMLEKRKHAGKRTTCWKKDNMPEKVQHFENHNNKNQEVGAKGSLLSNFYNKNNFLNFKVRF